MPSQRTIEADEEWQVPPIAQSPITGYIGAISWGALNKFSLSSRLTISDVEQDELINWMPQLSSFQQVPGPGPLIATLAASLIWSYTDILNGNLYTYYLCSDGKLYQVSNGGTIVTVGTGFTTTPNSCDITSWQGTFMLICDSGQSKTFSWSGSVLTTIAALTGTPANFICAYSGRLWLANGLVITWTNAGTYNSLGGDSGSFIITDHGCTNPVLGMFNCQGSLYLGGSNWWKTINNLVDVGTPAVLTFQQPTLTSQIGMINKWGVILWGAYLYFANLNGFWQLSGATPTKISGVLDGFFQNIVSAGSSFSAAYGVVLNKPCIFWQVQWGGDNNFTVFGYSVDLMWFRVIPVTGSGTGVCKWISGAVSSAITNNQSIVYYSDGTNIYNLFGSSTASVTSQFNTKLWSFYSLLRYDMFTNAAIQMVIFGAATITIAEVGSDNIVIGPKQGGGGGSLTYNFNPNVGQWINGAGVIGNWINGPSVAQGPINTPQNVAGATFKAQYSVNVRAGSLLVAFISSVVTVTGVADSLTQTWTQDAVSGNYVSIWRFANTAPGACIVTVTLSGSSNLNEIILWEFPGMALVAPVDVTAVNSGSGSGSAGVSLTTVNANDLIVAICSSGTAAGIATGGWTVFNTKYQNSVEYLPVFATGPYTANFTVIGSTWQAAAVAYKAAAGVGVQGNWQGTVSMQYLLIQCAVPFEERNMGLNITVTSAQAILQAMVVNYRKMDVSKG